MFLGTGGFDQSRSRNQCDETKMLSDRRARLRSPGTEGGSASRRSRLRGFWLEAPAGC